MVPMPPDPLLAALQTLDDRPLSAGQSTRQKILEKAAAIASLHGLEGLTVGQLSKELELSKSGLFAHFGSKEELQMAVVNYASRRFIEEIVRPALERDRGLERLKAMVDLWLAYVERSVFPGGCFFAAASLEFDGRPGAVREKINEVTAWWFQALEGEIREAQKRGELRKSESSDLLAFRLHAYAQEANWGSQMSGDSKWFQQARTAIRRAIEEAEK